MVVTSLSKIKPYVQVFNFTLLMQEEGVDITANSLHPGSIMTNLLRFHSVINSNTLIYLSRFLAPLLLFLAYGDFLVLD